MEPGSEITSEDGSAKVINSAKAKDGKNESSKDITVDVSKPDVQKTCDPWSDRSYLKWTITLNSNHKNIKNIQGNTLTDVIKSVNVNNSDKIVLPDEVEIWSDKNYTHTTHSFTNGQITFPIEGYGDTSEYYISYKTVRPVGTEGSEISVSNKAEFDGRTSESSYQEKVQVKDYGVNKWDITDAAKDVSPLSESERGLTWTARIDLPSSNVDINKIIYSDEIKDQDGIQNSEMHYTTTKTLIKSFNLWTEKGYSLEYGKDFWIFLNDQYVNSPGSDDKITNFKLIFTDNFIQKSLNGSTCISMRYQTIANVSGLAVGNQRLFKNSASIPDRPETTGKYTYKTTGDLDKQSSGSQNGGYKSSGVKVNLSAGEIYYRVSLHVGDDTQDITLTDTLPEGLEIDESSIDAKRAGSDEYQPNYEYYSNPWNEGSNIKDCLSYQISDDRRVLNISLKNYHDNGFKYIALYYKAKIKDPRWQENKDLEKITYENQIAWKEKNIHDSTVTEVDRDVKTLEKNVQQVQEEGGLTDDLEYSLVVNPLGRDLIPYSDSIQIHDQLTSKDNTEDSEARFLPDSVELFEYDADKNDFRGAVVDPNRYSYSYDTENKTISFNVPDSFPCIIVYRYHIIPGGVNLPTFSNTASIENVSESNTEITKKLEDSSSAAHAKQSVLYFYKVDADDYRIKLPGVEFTLSEYDISSTSNTGGWTNGEGTFKTDTDGLIKLCAGSNTGNLKKDTLYRLTETKNPNTAYQANSVITFFWESKKGAFQEFWNNNQGKINNVEFDQVHRLSDESLLMIPNKKFKSITVNKIWLGSDGKGLDSSDQPESVTVQLKRQLRKLEGVTVTVNVTNGSGGVGTNSIQIQKGSNIRIRLVLNQDVTYNGQKISKWDDNEKCNVSEVTLNDVEKDTVVNLNGYWDNSSNNAQKLITFHDYVLPSTYLKNGDPESVGDPFMLQKEKNWTKTITGLDYSGSDGYEYYYWVVEVPVEGYETIYSENNNSGIQTGTIRITNKKKIVLPETGGSGTERYLKGGLLLLLIGFVGCGLKIRQRGRMA